MRGFAHAATATDRRQLVGVLSAARFGMVDNTRSCARTIGRTMGSVVDGRTGIRCPANRVSAVRATILHTIHANMKRTDNGVTVRNVVREN